MATVKSFTDLEIWKRSRILANRVFVLCKEDRLSKDFALKDQMNRSAGAIMDNIAEGFGRGSKLEFIQFLTIARGSIAELQSQLCRCMDRQYIISETLDTLYKECEEISKMITSFISYLNKTEFKGQKFKSRVN